VRAGGQRFSIPQVNLLELVHLDDAQSATAIERVRDSSFYRLRGEILPILRLSTVLGLDGPNTAPPPDTLIVVLGVGSQRYGLIVDGIEDTEEIVIKPLHGQLKRISCFSGATVLGDGGVALILDVAGVATRAGIDLSAKRKTELDDRAEGQNDHSSWVVFRAGNGEQCAVPLAMVARLEKIPCASIERVAGGEIVQYRGAILPIVRPESVLAIGAAPPMLGEQPLIVFDFGQPVAMAVNDIVDVIEIDTARCAMGRETPYALGTLVVFDKATLILDVFALVTKLAPTHIKAARPAKQASRVLLVDDAASMRTAMSGYLSACGVDVVEAASAEAALGVLRAPQGGVFRALVTDLTMEGSDGFALLDQVKHEHPGLATYAWTHGCDEDEARRARAAGARACVDVMRREDLLVELSKLGIGTNADGGAL